MMRFRKNLRLISGQKRAHAGLKWKFLEKSRFTVRWSRLERVSEMKSILKKVKNDSYNLTVTFLRRIFTSILEYVVEVLVGTLILILLKLF